MKKAIFILIFSTLSAFAGSGETFSVGGSPSLELSNISGEINIRPGDSGQVEVNWEKEDERIEVEVSQQGDKIIVKVDYPKMTRTKGGVKFDVLFPPQGNLEINTVSGNINVTGVSGDLELQSVSGKIKLDEAGGRIEVNNVSGGITMTNMNTTDIEANTVSGNLTYEGELGTGEYEFNSTSGSITLDVNDDASFEVEGHTLSGKAEVSFEGLQVKREKYTSFSNIKGEVNGGAAEVEINTTSGSITIK